MYNSRTFSQKYQLFIVKNVIDSKIKTLRKSVRLQKNKTQNYSTTFINTFYLTLIDYIKPLSESSIDYKIKTHFPTKLTMFLINTFDLESERLHKIKRISVHTHTRQCVSEVAQVDVSDCRKLGSQT